QVITGIAIAAIVLAIAWIVWDVQSRRWIVDFAGSRIPAEEMQVHAALAQVHYDPSLHNELIDIIVRGEVLLQQANAAGIALTAEEREMLLPQAEMYSDHFSSVSTERMFDILGVSIEGGGALIPRIVDHYAPYEPDEAVLQQEFDDWMAENATEMELRTTEAKMIMSNDRDALDNIKAQAATIDADEFDAFASTTCILYNPEHGGAFTASIMDLVELFSLFDHEGELFAMEAGDTSTVLDLGEGTYVLVFMVDRPGIDEAQIEEWLRTQHVWERSAEIFEELLEGWIAAADYTVNSRVASR
ncbi:MAG: peptidylprolyl isomerase, partial [Defluviitaleaceae bacterium]|nr:peptidylprolyl isomerase [Defluviitaleaceae bacterium]